MHKSKFGLGADIEQVIKFKNRSRVFLSRIFTQQEIDYCLSKAHPPQHFAARYAVKEAVLKALNALGIRLVLLDLKQIEIIQKNSDPVPRLALYYPMKYAVSVYITMSHSGPMAIGFALAIG